MEIRGPPGAGRLGKEDRELLTAVARHRIGAAQHLRDQLRHVSQHLIPRLVTVGVVDPLEVVDVDHQQRERI